MKTPIILYGDGGVDLFKSLAEAESYAEPIDVRNHEYVAYDSEGRKLQLRIEEEVLTGRLGIGKTVKEIVRIIQVDEIPTHADELKNILRSALENLGAPSERLRTATLQELVIASTQKIGFS